MSNIVTETLCNHQYVGDKHHIFTFYESSRAAVKTWAQLVEQAQLDGTWYNTQKLYVLIDARQAPRLPIRYLLELLSDYNRAYPNLEPPMLDLAFVHSPDAEILDIYKMIVDVLSPPVNLQFFTDIDTAKAWLG